MRISLCKIALITIEACNRSVHVPTTTNTTLAIEHEEQQLSELSGPEAVH
jgi:hypothetical protein